jgi:hypothetical protein
MYVLIYILYNINYMISNLELYLDEYSNIDNINQENMIKHSGELQILYTPKLVKSIIIHLSVPVNKINKNIITIDISIDKKFYKLLGKYLNN